MIDTEITPDKIAAYRAAHYQVGTGPDPFILHIGRKSDALQRLFENTGRNSALFITAFNPFGQTLSDEENAAAHVRLETCLQSVSPYVIEGEGSDPVGDWPAEKSLLAIGIDEATARGMGAKFKQDAVVWAGPDGIPRLLLLR